MFSSDTLSSSSFDGQTFKWQWLRQTWPSFTSILYERGVPNVSLTFPAIGLSPDVIQTSELLGIGGSGRVR